MKESKGKTIYILEYTNISKKDANKLTNGSELESSVVTEAIFKEETLSPPK